MASEKELENQLIEAGKRLVSPPASSDELLQLLNQVGSCLTKVEQSPSESTQSALSPLIQALIADPLLRHSDVDIKVAVAACLSEITRISAPEAPYDDDQMREVFRLIVSSFENLSDNTSQSYAKRMSILDTVAKVRSCVVMLDLECDALIIEMFQHFLKAVRYYHPENVFSSMETIMTLVLEESEEIAPELFSPLLDSVKKSNEEVLPVAQKLAKKVLEKCADKIKIWLVQAVKSMGISLDEYSEVVASICQESPNATDLNETHNVCDQRVSEEKGTEVALSKPVDPAAEKAPNPVVSNGGITQAGDKGTSRDTSSLNKQGQGVADMSKTINASSCAEPEGAAKVEHDYKSEETTKTSGRETNSYEMSDVSRLHNDKNIEKELDNEIMDRDVSNEHGNVNSLEKEVTQVADNDKAEHKDTLNEPDGDKTMEKEVPTEPNGDKTLEVSSEPDGDLTLRNEVSSEPDGDKTQEKVVPSEPDSDKTLEDVTSEPDGDKTLEKQVPSVSGGDKTPEKEALSEPDSYKTLENEVPSKPDSNRTLENEVSLASDGDKTLVKEVTRESDCDKALVKEVSGDSEGDKNLVKELSRESNIEKTLVKKVAVSPEIVQGKEDPSSLVNQEAEEEVTDSIEKTEKEVPKLPDNEHDEDRDVPSSSDSERTIDDELVAETVLPTENENENENEDILHSSSPKEMVDQNSDDGMLAPIKSLSAKTSKKAVHSNRKRSLKETAPLADDDCKNVSEATSGLGRRPKRQTNRKEAIAVLGGSKSPAIVDISKVRKKSDAELKQKQLKMTGNTAKSSAKDGKKGRGEVIEEDKNSSEEDEKSSNEEPVEKEMKSISKSSKKSSNRQMKKTPTSSSKGKRKASDVRGYGENLVGVRIKVLWPMDAVYYPGEVESFDPVDKTHKVSYDDGDVEVLKLEEETWDIINSDTELDEQRVAGPSNQDASLEKPQKKKAKSSGGLSANRIKGRASLTKGGASSSKSQGTGAKSGTKSGDISKNSGGKLKGKASSKSDDHSGGRSKDRRSGSKANNVDKKLKDDSSDTPKTSKSKNADAVTPKSSKSKQDSARATAKSKRDLPSITKGKHPRSTGKSDSDDIKLKTLSSKAKKKEVTSDPREGHVKKRQKATKS